MLRTKIERLEKKINLCEATFLYMLMPEGDGHCAEWRLSVFGGDPTPDELSQAEKKRQVMNRALRRGNGEKRSARHDTH